MLGFKKEEASRDWKEILIWYSLPYIIKIIRSRG
jgi:hypothetical protein